MRGAADPRVARGRVLSRRVTVMNARTLVVQIRTWSDFADGDEKTKLRNLASRAEALVAALEELAA